MKRLLLLSSSFCFGGKYLEYAEDEIKNFLGDTKEILFVPYAGHDRDGYAAFACRRLAEVGYAARSIHAAPDPQQVLREASAIFIGGGNTFRLLKALYDNKLIEPIRERVEKGELLYMGASAGSNVACVTMKTTNDMPIVYPPSFDALNLVSFNINPHYLDPDPSSTHMGETREERIKEFLEENDRTVVGLREGGILHIEDEHITLCGRSGARVFRHGAEPEEFQPICELKI